MGPNNHLVRKRWERCDLAAVWLKRPLRFYLLINYVNVSSELWLPGELIQTQKANF